MRAPSRCTARPSSRATPRRRASPRRGQTEPPELLCVFSSATIEARGVWNLPAGMHRHADLPRARARPRYPGRPRVCSPECIAAPPSSRDHDVRRLLDDQLGTAPAEDRERDLVRHRRGRQVDGLLLAEELGAAPLERDHGRILAPLLVAHLGIRHRLPHRRSTAGSACRSGGRSFHLNLTSRSHPASMIRS